MVVPSGRIVTTLPSGKGFERSRPAWSRKTVPSGRVTVTVPSVRILVTAPSGAILSMVPLPKRFSIVPSARVPVEIVNSEAPAPGWSGAPCRSGDRRPGRHRSLNGRAFDEPCSGFRPKNSLRPPLWWKGPRRRALRERGSRRVPVLHIVQVASVEHAGGGEMETIRPPAPRPPRTLDEHILREKAGQLVEPFPPISTSGPEPPST